MFLQGKTRYIETGETVREVAEILGCPATKAELPALAKKKFGSSQEIGKP